MNWVRKLFQFIQNIACAWRSVHFEKFGGLFSSCCDFLHVKPDTGGDNDVIHEISKWVWTFYDRFSKRTQTNVDPTDFVRWIRKKGRDFEVISNEVTFLNTKFEVLQIFLCFYIGRNSFHVITKKPVFNFLGINSELQSSL